MLTTEAVAEHLRRLSYKPGWEFQIKQRSWEGPYIRITFEVDDTYVSTGEVTVLGINTYLPSFESVEEFERWLFSRILRIENHEAREFFKRDGEIIWDPHAEGEAMC